MKILNRIFFGLAVISLVSCAPIFSPGVNFENYSDKYIDKVQFNWNGYSPWASGKIYPGRSFGQTFYIRKKSDIFGPVHLEWENAVGRKLTKDFVLEKSQLDFDKKQGYIGKNIYFYFTQEDVDMYISQGWPDQYLFQKKEKRQAEVQQKLKVKKSK